MPDFDMSPYGLFVWGSWGLSAVTLAGLSLYVWRRAAQARRLLRRLEPAGDEAAETGQTAR